MTLKNIFDRICRLDEKAQALSARLRYDPLTGFMAPLCPDPDSSGQDTLFLFIKHSLENIMGRLYDVHEAVCYLKKPDLGEFTLERFPDGQAGYYDNQGCRHTLSYANRLTANLPDIPGKPRWVRTSVYYNGKDYFLWNHGVVPLPGLTIRERR